MKIVLKIFKASSALVIPAIICGILAANSFTAMIAIIHKALQGNIDRLYIILFFICLVTFAVTEIISRRLFLRISFEISANIMEEMSHIILSSKLRMIEFLSPHKLFAVLHIEIGSISAAISDLATTIIRTLQLIGLLTYFLVTVPSVLLIALIMLPIMALLYLYPTSRANRFIDEERRAGWRVNKRLEEVVFGFRELSQNRNKSQLFIDLALRPTIENNKNIALKNRTFELIFSHLADVLLYSGIAIVIFVGGSIDENNLVAVRDLVLFALVLKGPAATVIDHFGKLYRANIHLKNIERLGFDLQKIYSSELEPSTSISQAPFLQPQKIDLKELVFNYNNTESTDRKEAEGFCVGPINLTINKGEILFIVGGNGSGKTTLLKLICGLYEPSVGSVYLNDIKIDSENYHYYKDMFHVIFADFFMFEQIHHEKMSELNHKVDVLLKKFKLDQRIRIGPNGHISDINLSTGQKKRVAMITSLLEDRPILIFDEWAADQDPSFKYLFYNTLLPELKAQQKIIIVVSHDDHYFHVADKLIKLTEGRIN